MLDRENIVTYLEKLHPWCIVRLLPNLQRIVVGRFRRRNDAIAHCQVLQKLVPHAAYTIIFDVGQPQVEGKM